MHNLYLLRIITRSILYLNLLWYSLVLQLGLLLSVSIVIQEINGRRVLNEKVINIVVIYNVCYVWLHLLHLWSRLYHLLLGTHLCCDLMNPSLLIQILPHQFIVHWHLLIGGKLRNLVLDCVRIYNWINLRGIHLIRYWLIILDSALNLILLLILDLLLLLLLLL